MGLGTRRVRDPRRRTGTRPSAETYQARSSRPHPAPPQETPLDTNVLCHTVSLNDANAIKN